ncbi:MAG TPA: glycerophosphodiester phosphodiesterase [Actinomycetota bacterium]
MAHRGASSTHPENTIPAFEAAIAVGARILELDVRLSRDGVPVVMHDPTVERTTGGTGGVHELTAAEIGALEAGTASLPAAVPRLRDVMDVASGRAALAIEIKHVPGEPAFDPTREAIVEAVHRELEATGFEGPVLVISFNPASIDASRAMAPEVPTGLLTTDLVDPDEALAYAVRGAHAMVLPGTRALNPAGAAFVGRVHAAGLRVGTWTVDDPAEVRRLLEWGVDAVASNDPAMAVDVVSSWSA